jgi:basic membrane protein A and related proteins
MARNLVVAASVAALMLTACGSKTGTPDAGAAPIKVGFIYVGPRSDYGWTKSHEDARLYLEQYGKNVKTEFIESVAPADGPAKYEELYNKGCTVIFGTSFDFLATSLDQPTKHSDLWTLNCSGFKTANHAGNYQARVEEAEYLTGMIAGKMTKTNKIGIVGALRIYEQMMHMNAFTLGVRSVNPTAVVLVRWVGDWFNPAMEQKGAEELINLGGVDVVKGLTDTNIPITTADAMKTPAPGNQTVWTIGHDNKDYCNAATHGTCLTSSFYNWGPYYVKVVGEIADKTYPAAGRMDYLGSKDMSEIVGISTMSSSVPSDVQTLVLAKQQDIIKGSFNVFQGPFKYDDGTAWKATGETLTDNDLICTKRFVEGIANFDGPACTKDADCDTATTTGKLTCDLAQSKCKAPDLSGCSP